MKMVKIRCLSIFQQIFKITLVFILALILILILQPAPTLGVPTAAIVEVHPSA